MVVKVYVVVPGFCASCTCASAASRCVVKKSSMYSGRFHGGFASVQVL